MECRYLWQGGGLGESEEWTDWDTLAVIDNLYLTWFEHDSVNTGGCYRYRVRAGVESGSELDQALVSHDFLCETTPPPSGCPVLFVWDGDAFRPENNILATRSPGEERGADNYLVRGPLRLVDGRVQMEVREDEVETTRIDGCELLAVDHEPDGMVGVTAGGEGFIWREVAAPLRARDDAGRDRAAELRVAGGGAVYGVPGDALVAEFGAAPGTALLVGVIQPADPEKSPGPDVFLQRVGGPGGTPGWRRVGSIAGRKIGGTQFLDLGSSLGGPAGVRVRLEWTAPVWVDRLGLVEMDEPVYPVRVPVYLQTNEKCGGRHVPIPSRTALHGPRPRAAAVRPGRLERSPPGDLPAPGRLAREDLLHRCRSCRVVLPGGGRIEGRLIDVRSDSLEIEVETTRFDESPFRPSVDETVRKTIPLDEVSSVRCGDRVYNGVILGFLAGGLPAAAIASGVTAGDGADPGSSGGGNRGAAIGVSLLFAGAVGALVGYLIDNASGSRGEVSLEVMRIVAGK